MLRTIFTVGTAAVFAVCASVSASPIDLNTTTAALGARSFFESGHEGGVYFECYSTGACQDSDASHGQLERLVKDINEEPADDADYRLTSPGQILQCVGDLCVWVGDTHGHGFTQANLSAAAAVIRKRCRTCGSAAFGPDQHNGLMQINKPCKCTAGGGKCGPGQNWVLSTSC